MFKYILLILLCFLSLPSLFSRAEKSNNYNTVESTASIIHNLYSKTRKDTFEKKDLIGKWFVIYKSRANDVKVKMKNKGYIHFIEDGRLEIGEKGDDTPKIGKWAYFQDEQIISIQLGQRREEVDLEIIDFKKRKLVVTGDSKTLTLKKEK